MKRSSVLLLGILVAGIPLLSGNRPVDGYGKKPLQVFREGEKVKKQINAFFDGAFGYVPVRDVARLYKMTIDWKRVSKKVFLSIHGRSVELILGSRKVVINDVPRQMNRETIDIHGVICVPLELLLAQSFAGATHYKTEWNRETLTLTLDKNVSVHAPHFYSDGESTTIIIEYAHYVICRDSRRTKSIVLTFDHGISGKDEKFNVNDGIIKNITMKQRKRKVVVEIFLAKKHGTSEIHYEKNPHRIRVVIDKKSIERTAIKRKRAMTARTIVIDPGHGGKDPGAIGRNGTREKVINLKIALRLAKMLERNTNYTIILTRDKDVFIPLLDRARKANTLKADLFVSIHCNSSLKKTTNGFEIYFLSGKATDKAAAATARLENSALQLEKDSKVKKKRVDTLLWSIARNLFHRESAEVCLSILKQVQKRVKIKNRFAKQARFYVLMNAQMPSVLIEMGFLSNRAEEARIKSRRFQTKMVSAYYAGIVHYFNNK